MQRLFIKTILSLVLSASILCGAFNLTTEKSPDQKQVLEACMLCHVFAWAEWLKNVDWSKGGYHFRFPPKKGG